MQQHLCERRNAISKILVVYCSLSGNTKATAEAVAEGARSTGAAVLVKGHPNGKEITDLKELGIKLAAAIAT